MGKIKIKIKNPTEENKIKLLRILSCNYIYATRILTTYERFTVLTNTDAELDKIVSKELTRELKKENFNPVTPPELKATRTVIPTRLDDYIYRQNETDIKEELTNHNHWINQEDITEIFKFPNSKTFKITFDQT